MSNTNTGGPAFPMPGMSGLPNDGFIYGQDGMTLRDYFAAKALQAILAHPDSDADKPTMVFADAAYEMADAMLKAREA